MPLGYARVSKGDEQRNGSQAKALRAAGCRRICEEAASGGRWDRPELHRMLDQRREGDMVVVSKLDRLLRPPKNVLHIMDRIGDAEAGFRSLTENIDATSRAGRAMAKAVGISLRSVQRIRDAHKLQPHRVHTFKRSCDPDFAAKLTDIVGLYLDPPTRAVVLSIDEKSQIHALYRTQPGLPLKPGRCGTVTHDYKRHGTTALFAVLNGWVVGRCKQQQRHAECIRFLNGVEGAIPTGKLVEAVVGNYATHKYPKVKAWLERHRRRTFHFTPTSGWWLNGVEKFFSVLTRRRIRRGRFHPIADLQVAVRRYLAERNAEPRPFVRKASDASILAKLERIPASSA